MNPVCISVDSDQITEQVILSFDLKHEGIASIGKQITDQFEAVTMDADNWQKLILAYTDKYCLGLSEGMSVETCNHIFKAYFTLHDDNVKKANLLREILLVLFEDSEKLCRFINEHGLE